MIKAVIVDDEIAGAEVLEYLVKQYCPDIEIISIQHSVDSAIDTIKKVQPDLVFLDIEMPTGTGFDVIKNTSELNYVTIFITAYENYAIKAFKTNALDYLLKPIDIEELVNAVEKVRKKINNSKSSISNDLEEVIINSLNKNNNSNKRLAVSTFDGVIMLDTNDVIYLEADSNYTNVYMKDNKKMLISKTLKYFEDSLPNSSFFRVHKTFIINISAIVKYLNSDGGYIILSNNAKIPISRSKKNELMQKLNVL
ncbi:MAG: LytTR family DNA-binding domain-containing protein [Limnohabitans sp.]|nr:LytTR family DNA-binding domain-containing protein [Limnohabitans sp.]